ncbi:Na+/H+ antiporter NhaC [Sedimentibacter sp. zth1]|uniref:Na+/H+ antiporter NhaC n=1 Tax=Sedimentibacter sp. zth1 TaxID=2816908 RepID=UPI001A9214C5|nr:Na+/H+ antiporter NhaC [Sedimentibacter sp. zth1]QSX06761.1 Na+/H+ antiporter NhaC [Sedimentibacter sp. zth1]
MKTKEKKTPSFAFSLMTLLALATFLIVMIRAFGAPLNVAMFIAWIFISLLSIKLGFTYRELENVALDTIRRSLSSVVIMLAVGALIGVFIAAGTVPTIIFYGMKIISAKYYLVTTLLLCAIVSMFTGTSWGTIGTVGVALLGIGEGLGIPLGMIAGAIISGSWFGDKLSPLSDTTNFAAGVMGIDVMVHVKHMLYSTIPALITSAIIFLFLGFRISGAEADFTLMNQISDGLAANFHIGLITLVPMIIVVTMLLRKQSAVVSILSGVIAAIFIAIFYQGLDPKTVLTSFMKGYNQPFEQAYLCKLLNRGGMNCMNSTVQAVIFTTGIGGMIREIGIIKVLVSKFSSKIKTVGGLVASAIGVSYLSIGITGSHCFSAIMVQSTMLDLYRQRGLKPENLSRICEDCGTIGVTIIPWGVTAIFIINTLNIPFATYFPFAFFCFLCPIFSLLCGITGIGMAKYTDEEMQEFREQGLIN